MSSSCARAESWPEKPAMFSRRAFAKKAAGISRCIGNRKCVTKSLMVICFYNSGVCRKYFVTSQMSCRNSRHGVRLRCHGANV
jgi:hypothetical protein